MTADVVSLDELFHKPVRMHVPCCCGGSLVTLWPLRRGERIALQVVCEGCGMTNFVLRRGEAYNFIRDAMAAHENLAGGLCGGAGVLWASWLAFQAIQEQMAAERELRERQKAQEDDRRRRQQAEAKEVAVMAIAPTVHAAATALEQINRALLLRANDTRHSDSLVATAVTYVQSALDTFTVRESARDLGLEDRLAYLAIVSTLNTFISTSTQPSPDLGRMPRLENQKHALMNIHGYLRAFNADLANVYAGDSQTTAPA